MSEKVQSMARDIYAEFENLLKKYDEKVVEDLTPLVVNVLEALESTHVENEEHKAEVEVLREDNEQLMQQYDREKKLRKQLDQKTVESEDVYEEEKRKLQDKMDSMEAIVRMLELKAKNATDQVSRLEDKEKETRKEYEKVHDRYSQLFKTHVEQLERTRYLLAASNMEDEYGRLAMGDGQKEPPSSDREIGLEDEDAPVRLAQRGRRILTSMEERMRSASSSTFAADAQAAGLVHGLQVPSERRLVPQRVTSFTESEMSMEPDDMDLNEKDDKKQDAGSDNESDAGISEGQGLRMTSATDRADADAASGRFPFAISREIEELIRENNDLLATKNALNVVKDDLIAQVDELCSEKDMLRDENQSLQDVKQKYKERIALLEDNMKKMREQYELKLREASNEDSDQTLIPYAQQKRFTRMEMARLVMEKNKYKQELMELQDEMRAKLSAAQRAVLQHPRQKSFFRSLFGGLFGTSRSRDSSSLRHSDSTNFGTLSASPSQSVASRSPPPSEVLAPDASDVLDLQAENNRSIGSPEHNPTPAKAGRNSITSSASKGQQGRLQAYGWSVPAVKQSGTSSTAVPVPIYSRPLLEKDIDMKIWCAVGFELRKPGDALPEIPQPSAGAPLPGSEEARLAMYASANCCIWICSSTHSAGKVTVLDANRPNDVLESFPVCSSHLLCISLVPGYDSKVGVVEGEHVDPLMQRDVGGARPVKTVSGSPRRSARVTDLGDITYVSCASGSSGAGASASSLSSSVPESVVLLGSAFLTLGYPKFGTVSQLWQNRSFDGRSETVPEAAETVEPDIPADSDLGRARLDSTIWIGSQKGGVYVYQANRNYRRRIGKVVLPDAVLSIAHVNDRVLASLSDGTVAIFRRRKDAGWWDLANYHLLSLGQPEHAIRALAVVPVPFSDDTSLSAPSLACVWAGCRNMIHVFDPVSLKLRDTFEAHSRQDSVIRQMVTVGQGVWISLRMDNTLRLFHARTLQHLQDLPVDPIASLVSGRSFSVVRITAMTTSAGRFWIGTSSGVIISIPLTMSLNEEGAGDSSSGPSLDRDIPFCSSDLAQVSFHGHKEEVKFFVSVPGNFRRGSTVSASSGSKDSAVKTSPTRSASTASIQEIEKSGSLLVSGGEGYVDFRMDDASYPYEDSASGASGTTGHSEARLGRSHLIVWQVSQSSNAQLR